MGIFFITKVCKFDLYTKSDILPYILYLLLLTIAFTGATFYQSKVFKKKLKFFNALQKDYDRQIAFLKDVNKSFLDIAGNQAKERKMVTDNLHDNLGSMMASLKLNFEALGVRADSGLVTDDDLYSKTGLLIEEAYQKVRLIAQPQYEGAYADNGMLPSLKKLAGMASLYYDVDVAITAFGFVNRISNDKEFAVVWVVKEILMLLTGFEAAGIKLLLSQTDNSINLITEFNVNDKLDDALAVKLFDVKQQVVKLEGKVVLYNDTIKSTIEINIPV